MIKKTESVKLIKMLVEEKRNMLQPDDPMVEQLNQLMNKVDNLLKQEVCKNIAHMMSHNPDQKKIYLKEDWSTNFQDIKMLLTAYHPETRGFVTTDEKLLIHQALHFKRRDILDLQNLRDFVVLFLSKGAEKEEVRENMDKMSAITTVIDQKIWELGGEV